MAGRYFRAALTALLLGGCDGLGRQPEPITLREPVRVEIPVPVRATPPAELLAPLALERPEFVAPTDPRATSALTPEGEKQLRRLVLDLFARVDAWRAWATAP
jgi:hypothetical protein